MKILPLIFAVITIIAPVITQKTGLSKKYGIPLKMLCAAFYLITGILSAVAFGTVTDYCLMMLGALVLGFLGDFFLDFRKNKLFPAGVAFFALGHIAFSIAFLLAGESKALSHIGAVTGLTLVIMAAIVIFAKVKLRLSGKKNMLLLYAVVLVFAFSCAVVRGAAELFAGNKPFGLCLIAGGVLFFASDIMIGVEKGGMKRPEFLHYAVSYTYFAAQSLFALSILFQ